MGSDTEHWYSLAVGDGIATECNCHAAHGGNPSCVKAYEAWTGRKPFLLSQPGRSTKIRLASGVKFFWRGGEEWTVTSFCDATGVVRAAQYREVSEYKRAVSKRLNLSHGDVAAFNTEAKAR